MGQAPTVLELKDRQVNKIREIRDALIQSGADRLDAQAAALGISRSTTWHMLWGSYKGSGLSSPVIVRMLASPDLRPAVRAKILEYVRDKSRGHYGGTKQQLRRFVRRMKEHDCCRVAIESLSDSGDFRTWESR